MVRRVLVIAFILTAVLAGEVGVQAWPQKKQASSSDHVAWVAEALTRMQTIKPGMTRADLLKVFTTEGGVHQALRRTYVSRDCPYFKVDVQFQAVGRPSRDESDRGTAIEDPRDIIVAISRPYLQSSIID